MATIELTVAYPGREGAHSAAACDRLFPAAGSSRSRLPRRGRSGRVGPRPATASSRSRARSSARSPRRTTSSTSRRSRSSRRRSSRSTIASSGPAPVELAQIREIHSHPVALDQCRKLIASLPHALAVAAPTTADAASIVADLGDPPSSRSRATARRASTGSRSSTATSATIPRRTRGSSRSPRTRASTAATASGGRRSRSRPTTAPERSSMRSSLSPATESTSTSSSRGRFPSARSATASTRFSAAIRSTRRSPRHSREMARSDDRAPGIWFVPFRSWRRQWARARV